MQLSKWGNTHLKLFNYEIHTWNTNTTSKRKKYTPKIQIQLSKERKTHLKYKYNCQNGEIYT